LIHHIVTFIWNEQTTPADVERVRARLAELPDQVPVLLGYAFGSDIGLTQGNGDFAIIATVAEVADLPEYANHPSHVEVVGELRAMARTRIAVQIESDQLPSSV
jgi:Stress responsive A/B Barrel Domain